MRQTLRLAFLLLPLVSVLAACDDGVDPVIPGSDVADEFARIVVTPASAELSVVAPGNTVALTTMAVTRDGAQFSTSGAVVTYESSAPTTASVSSDGLVTGLAAGNAVITVETTIGGVTRSGTMTIVVLGLGSWPAVGGVYDLVATITHSDPVWGIPNGTQQLATLTIQHTGDTRPFTGTFADLRAVEPGGTTSGTGVAGLVTGTVQTDGRIVVELFNVGQQSSYWYGSGTLAGQDMSGNFGAGGHITGTFTATRR